MENKNWLYLKRAFVLFMGTLLVWQTFGTDVTSALANSAAETVQALTQPAATSDNGAADGISSTDAGTAVSGDATMANDGTSNGTNSDASNDDANDADGRSDGVANEADGQSDDAAIMPVGESGSGYNPSADFVDISNNCSATVTLYSDASHTTPLGSTAIPSNQTFYGNLNINYGSITPVYAQPNVCYVFPSNVKVADLAETDLYDGSTKAGTWYIQNNVAYFKYDESYLARTVMLAYVKFDAKLNGTDKGDGGNEQISFAGTSESITVNTKDGSVNGSKSASEYDAATNSYTWTIKVSPVSYATDVKITDTLGSNVSFDQSSFKLVDASGSPVSGTLNTSFDGKVATIGLGNLTAGDYYVQYKVTVDQLPSADNTDLDNIGNTAKFVWGSTGENNNTTNGWAKSVRYAMVSKSADGSSTPEKIKWTVTLNNGSLLANMNGYQFSDNAGDNQTFLTGEGFTVTDASGATITPSSQSFTEDGLSFTLPSTVGKQQVTVTYYTTMTDASSKDTVSNTAAVTPGPESEGPEGTGTGSYNPPDTAEYITKTLTSTVDPSNYDGTATWSSTINFSTMSKTTDAASIKFTDQFSGTPEPWDCVSITPSDVTVSATNGVTLTAGTDYELTTAANVHRGNDFITIQFKDTANVRSLVGAEGAAVTVSYKTTTTPKSDSYVAGTYTNRSTIATGKVTKSATASFNIEEKVVAPAVAKSVASNPSWNADYEWADGTKGAWIVGWTVKVNQKDGKAVMDLNDQDVTITDTLPENTEVVAGSSTYKVMEKNGYNGSADTAVTPVVSDRTVTFTAVTADATYTWGAALETPVSVVLSYQTATKNVDAGTSVTLENTAQASSGSVSFPGGSATTTIANKVLSKEGSAVQGTAARRYTIKVNENSLDLDSNSDTLTLSDDMDSRGELTSGSITITSGSEDLIASGKASYELTKVQDDSGSSPHTRLTIKVPDGMSVQIQYSVMPSGNEGDWMADFSNSCSLSGNKAASTSITQSFSIASSSGGTSAEVNGIKIRKTDSASNTLLNGAKFELYSVDLVNSTVGDLKATKVAEGTTGAITTDGDGVVSFGTKDSPLATNALFYYVETEAPAGYEITYKDPTYFMLKGSNTSEYNNNLTVATSLLGYVPSSANEFNAYDKLEAGSFSINVTKAVEGANAPDDQSFEFTATATGDNADEAPSLDAVSTTGAGTATFTGALDEDMLGKSFVYEIRESTPATVPEGWTYDGTVYKAYVEVVAQDGQLVGDVALKKVEGDVETDASSVTFTNQYSAGTSVTLYANKTLAGATLTDGQFHFVATENVDGGEANVAAGVNGLKGDGTDTGLVTFQEIEYTEPGTHTYTLSEDSDDATTKTKVDSTQYKVVVEVAKGDDGALVATPTYYDADGTTALDAGAYPTFANSYDASSIDVTLNAAKTLTGADIADYDGAFRFNLYTAEDGATSKWLETATNDESGDIEFTSLNFTENEKGTYWYKIVEMAGKQAGMSYSTAEFYAKVTVYEGEDEELRSYVTYYDADKNPLSTGAVPTFANAYTEASGAFELSLQKFVNDTIPGAGQSFEFSATATGDNASEAPALANVTASAENNGLVSFEGTLADANESKTYTYRINEVTDVSKLPGEGTWTAAGDVTATVVVGARDADGKLSATVSYSNATTDGASALFNNVYAHKNAEEEIKVAKTVNGGAIAEGEYFSFKLYDQNGNQVGDEITATKANPTVSFGKVSFSEEGIYTYTIHETSELGNGWTNDSDFTVKITVEEIDVTSPTHDLKVSKVEYDDASRGKDENGVIIAAFNNTYTATGSATISVDKSVAGGTEALASESFTFELYHANEWGNIEGDAIETVSTTAGKRVNFTKISYSQVGNKTYRYVIKETGHNEGAWFAAANVGVTVNTTDDGKGNLTCEVLYNGSKADAAQFVNTYAPATVQLKVEKTVNGGAITTGEKFTFVLKDSEDKQLGSEVTATKDNPTVAFDAVTVTAPGTYTYTIHETSELGDGWTNDSDFTATVTVERDSKEKKLVVSTVEYNDSKRGCTKDGAYIAKFDDTYKAVGNAVIRVNKKVNGATDAVAGETFYFQLKEGDKVLSTAQTKAGGTTTFGGISFSTEDIGKTFNYTIHETGHNEQGWTADSDVPVKIEVTDTDGDLKPEVNVTYGNNRGTTLSDGTTAAAFTNKYEASGVATISVYKTVNGSATAKQDETFTFDLYKAVEVDGKVQKVGEAIDHVSTKAGATGTFSEVKITKEGTYYYYVHETGHNSAGWTADDDVLVTVVAKDKDGKGKLSLTTTYSRANEAGTAAAFDNKFEAAKGTISVEKTVNGGPIAEGEKFTFTLTDENGKQVGEEITAAKDAPTVSFGELEFEKVGTYAYTVHETTELADGWTNDDDVTVELTVEDVDGKLTVTKTSYTDDRGYDKDGNYITQFDDAYEAVAAEGEIKVEKTVNGGPIEEGEKFTFTLIGEDGKQVEGTSEVTATKDEPTVSFGKLEFDHAGTYVYTVHETSELGDGWTNDDDFIVTFTVELGEDRNLHITNVAYGARGYEADGSVVVKFDNKFEAPKGEDAEQARKRLAQTGDPFGNSPVAAIIAAAGLACLAGALAAARRRRQE